MNQSDKLQFKKIMEGMADNFRDTITQSGMRMRFEMLKEFNIEQVEQAAKAIMARRKYTKMPPVADFIEELTPKPIAVEDGALAVANDIVSHLKQFGSTVVPDLDHDPIAQTLMTRRWPYRDWAAAVKEKDIVWWIKEFVEAYRTYTATGGALRLECPRGGMGKIGDLTKLIGNVPVDAEV